jgi:hypothetical protein
VCKADAAAQALVAHGGDIEAAANSLMDGGSRRAAAAATQPHDAANGKARNSAAAQAAMKAATAKARNAAAAKARERAARDAAAAERANAKARDVAATPKARDEAVLTEESPFGAAARRYARAVLSMNPNSTLSDFHHNLAHPEKVYAFRVTSLRRGPPNSVDHGLALAAADLKLLTQMQQHILRTHASDLPCGTLFLPTFY